MALNFRDYRPAPTDYVMQDTDLVLIQSANGREPFQMSWGRFTSLVGSGGGGQGAIPINTFNQSGAVTIPDFTAEQKLIEGFEKIDVVIGEGVGGSTVINAPANANNINSDPFDPEKTNIFREQWIGGSMSYTIEHKNTPDTVAPLIQSASTSTNGLVATLTYNEGLIGTPLYTITGSVTGAKTISSQITSASTVIITVTVAFQAGETITVSGGGPTDAAGNPVATLSNYVVTNNVASFSNTHSVNSAGLAVQTSVNPADLTFRGVGTVDKPGSIVVWVKPSAASAAAGSGYMYYTSTSGHTIGWTGNVLNFQLQDDLTNGAAYIGKIMQAALSSDVWHCIVITYDGFSVSSGIKIYDNGTLLTTNNLVSGTYGRQRALVSGTRYQFLARAGMQYDEYAFLDKELTQGEVTAISTAPVNMLTMFPSNLKSWWKFDNNLLDSGPSDYDMTGTATYSTDVKV